jgi:hypothetical protein
MLAQAAGEEAVSNRSLRSIQGRLEYDAISYFYAKEDYCKLRLNLFDLPASTIITIETTRELGAQVYCRYRAYRVPAWKLSYREEFTIRSWGTLSVKVYQEKPKYIHQVRYRIDPDERRPIREFRDLLELYVEDHLYDLEDMKRFGREKPLDFPRGSLWLLSAT